MTVSPVGFEELETYGHRSFFTYRGILNGGANLEIYRSPIDATNPKKQGGTGALKVSNSVVGTIDYKIDNLIIDNRIMWVLCSQFAGETRDIEALHGWLAPFVGRTSISQHVAAILEHQGLITPSPTDRNFLIFPSATPPW